MEGNGLNEEKQWVQVQAGIRVMEEGQFAGSWICQESFVPSRISRCVMKRWPLLLLPIWFAGCSANDNLVEIPTVGRMNPARIIPYIHLAVGDSLGYGWADTLHSRDTVSPLFFTHIYGTDVIGGQAYFQVASYPVGPGIDGHPIWLMMRQDAAGNVFVIFPPITLETLIYKTRAETGSTWNLFYFYAETLQCRLISRNDTVRSFGGIFPNCLKIQINWPFWGCHENHWLAPGIGLVKRTFEYLPGPHRVRIGLDDFDLKSLRLKSTSRR
jgi:hypothetical protein